VKLIPISEHPDAANILYQLLEEREAHVNISHRAMPDWETHLHFIEMKPYAAWYLIELPPSIVGSIYLSKSCEIGVQLFKTFRGKGYGPAAVKALMAKHSHERYLANVNPENDVSRKMFEALGFRTIQHTLALDAD
jgi:RimJ/RimL family protein N-acetyltransferase